MTYSNLASSEKLPILEVDIGVFTLKVVKLILRGY